MNRVVFVACALGTLVGVSFVSAEVPRKVLAINGKCPRRHVLKNDNECAPSELCRDHSIPRMDGACPEDTPEVRNLTCATAFVASAEEAGVPAATGGGCSGASARAPRRRLFVANGRVVDVLHKYLDDAERHKIIVPLETLSVHYFDHNGQQKTVALPAKPGWAAIFSDSTPLRRWEQLLGAETAQARDDATGDARVLQADVVCGD